MVVEQGEGVSTYDHHAKSQVMLIRTVRNAVRYEKGHGGTRVREGCGSAGAAGGAARWPGLRVGRRLRGRAAAAGRAGASGKRVRLAARAVAGPSGLRGRGSARLWFVKARSFGQKGLNSLKN